MGADMNIIQEIKDLKARVQELEIRFPKQEVVK